MVMQYLSTVWGDARSDDMQMGVVGIIVGIDQQRLSFLSISHFRKIAVGKVQQLRFCHFMPFAGKGNVKLCLLDTDISGGVFLKICD